MSLISRGIYETLLTESLVAELATLAAGLQGSREKLRSAEAADRLSFHVARIVKHLVGAVDKKQRVRLGVKLTRHLIAGLVKVADSRLPAIADSIDLADRPVQPGEMLRAIHRVLPDGTVETIRHPMIPLLDTAILTNAPGEPSVGSQLLAEIHSADSIDLVMAFIRYTWIAPMLDTLTQHMQSGRKLRVLTTTYTGSTEARALDALQKAGAEIMVSYDTGTTRLHAKRICWQRSPFPGPKGITETYWSPPLAQAYPSGPGCLIPFRFAKVAKLPLEPALFTVSRARRLPKCR